METTTTTGGRDELSRGKVWVIGTRDAARVGRVKDSSDGNSSGGLSLARRLRVVRTCELLQMLYAYR